MILDRVIQKLFTLPVRFSLPRLRSINTRNLFCFHKFLEHALTSSAQRLKFKPRTLAEHFALRPKGSQVSVNNGARFFWQIWCMDLRNCKLLSWPMRLSLGKHWFNAGGARWISNWVMRSFVTLFIQILFDYLNPSARQEKTIRLKNYQKIEILVTWSKISKGNLFSDAIKFKVL